MILGKKFAFFDIPNFRGVSTIYYPGLFHVLNRSPRMQQQNALAYSALRIVPMEQCVRTHFA